MGNGFFHPRALGLGGNHHKRRAVQRLVGTQGFEQLQPRQHRHVPVRQNQIDPLLAQHPECLGAIVGGQDVGRAQRAQLVADDFAHGLDVIDDQKHRVAPIHGPHLLVWRRSVRPGVCHRRR